MVYVGLYIRVYRCKLHVHVVTILLMVLPLFNLDGLRKKILSKQIDTSFVHLLVTEISYPNNSTQNWNTYFSNIYEYEAYILDIFWLDGLTKV